MQRIRSVACVLSLALATVLTATCPAVAQTGVAATPYMGWSSWSSFRCDIDAETIMEQASVLHTRLRSHGYDHVNIDSDCDSGGQAIDSFGRKIYDPAKFPNGIPPVADFVHGLGLKLGVYAYPGVPISAVEANTPIEGTPYQARDIIYPPAPGRPGNSFCQFGNTFRNTCRIDYSRPGAQAFIDSWANLFASWGIDLLKLDAVSPGSSTTQYDTRSDVEAWSRAIARSGREIQLILSWHLDVDDASFWKAHANGWRIDDDIECYDTCPHLTAWANPF